MDYIGSGEHPVDKPKFVKLPLVAEKIAYYTEQISYICEEYAGDYASYLMEHLEVT